MNACRQEWWVLVREYRWVLITSLVRKHSGYLFVVVQVLSLAHRCAVAWALMGKFAQQAVFHGKSEHFTVFITLCEFRVQCTPFLLSMERSCSDVSIACVSISAAIGFACVYQCCLQLLWNDSTLPREWLAICRVVNMANCPLISTFCDIEAPYLIAPQGNWYVIFSKYKWSAYYQHLFQ